MEAVGAEGSGRRPVCESALKNAKGSRGTKAYCCECIQLPVMGRGLPGQWEEGWS